MNDAGEIIKSGAGEKIADLFNKLAGPLAEEIGLMLGDTVRVYRVKNLIKTTQKTQRSSSCRPAKDRVRLVLSRTQPRTNRTSS
jgi:hypothetical protein